MSMVSEAFRNEETRVCGSRTVAGMVNSIETLEGGGFLVRRPFPKASFSEFDPFLLLDEMGPMELAPGEAKGAPIRIVREMPFPTCAFTSAICSSPITRTSASSSPLPSKRSPSTRCLTRSSLGAAR